MPVPNCMPIFVIAIVGSILVIGIVGGIIGASLISNPSNVNPTVTS
jgi:hypothetical protein